MTRLTKIEADSQFRIIGNASDACAESDLDVPGFERPLPVQIDLAGASISEYALEVINDILNLDAGARSRILDLLFDVLPALKDGDSYS